MIIGVAAAGSAQAHETDQFTTPPGREFADIGDYFTRWAYEAIEGGVRETNERIDAVVASGGDPKRLAYLRSADAIAAAVNGEFPDGYSVIESMERLVHSQEMKNRHPGMVVGYKEYFTNAYQNLHWPIDPRLMFRLWHSSTMKVYGVYLGTDKIGHFTDMGKNYYRQYRKSLEDGGDEQEAVESALRLGTSDFLLSEAGVLGELSAGAYSNADLVANYMGFLFYKNLTEPVELKGERRAPMLELVDGRWSITPDVRPNSDFFSYFFSDHWDESLNPSLFEWGMRDALRRAVAERATNLLYRYRDANGGRRPPTYFNTRVEQLGTYWGQEYGHHGTLDELVTLGNACYPGHDSDDGAEERNALGYTRLHAAALHGDVNEVRRLLEQGASINAQVRSDEKYSADWGDTALMLAARDGRAEIVSLLLGAGADVSIRNEWGATALHLGAPHEAVVERLIGAGAKIHVIDVAGRTPLHWAAPGADAQAVRLLLDHGAEADITDNMGLTPLHRAVAWSNPQAITALIEGGASVNAKLANGETPLHTAAMLADPSIAQKLLEAGGEAISTDGFGYTPLHVAARHGNQRVARMLLDHAAAINQPDSFGSTPLHLACRYDRLPIAELLLNRGAVCSRDNQAGRTALDEAAFAGAEQITSLLLAHESQLTAEAADSVTARQLVVTTHTLSQSP